MNSYSSTLLVTALKRSFTYLVSLDVPPIASIKFTVRRDNELEVGWLIEITYCGAEQKPDNQYDPGATLVEKKH